MGDYVMTGPVDFCWADLPPHGGFEPNLSHLQKNTTLAVGLGSLLPSPDTRSRRCEILLLLEATQRGATGRLASFLKCCVLTTMRATQ